MVPLPYYNGFFEFTIGFLSSLFDLPSFFFFLFEAKQPPPFATLCNIN